MRGRVRPYFYVLSLWSVLFLALGPALGTALSSSAGQFIQICTLYGFKNIQVAADLNPVAVPDQSQDPHPDAAQHCIFCQSREFSGLILPPQTVEVLHPSDSIENLCFASLAAPRNKSFTSGLYNARAPPVTLI